MPTLTDNHGLEVGYVDGEEWDYNDEMQTIEERLVVVDTEANRTNFTAYADALFRASDTGALYTGDGTSWTLSDGKYATLNATTVNQDGDAVLDASDYAASLTGYPIPNSDLSNDTVTVAGNAVGLGGSTAIDHADLANTSSSDHHTYPVPNTGLVNDTVTVAGNNVSLGGTTAVDHADLQNVGAGDHHTRPVPGSNITEDTSNNFNVVDAADGGSIDALYWDGYEVQKDGTDGTGIINFKTS